MNWILPDHQAPLGPPDPRIPADGDQPGRGRPGLKVALVPAPQTWQIEGGHRVQQAESAAALRDVGVDAQVVEVADLGSDRFDVLHYFGDPRPILAQRPSFGRLVVSPVYYPRDLSMAVKRWGRTRHAMMPRLLHHIGHVRHPFARRRSLADHAAQLSAIAQADLVVVNSNAEARLLRADAGVLPPVKVVYSGVHERFSSGDAARGRTIVGLQEGEPFVLSVARIEPNKNQLSVARAMRKIPAQLVLVGQVLPGNERYMSACVSELPSLRHINHLEHRDLPHIYAAARAHVLASWYETTGLSTAEALASGIPVVVGRSPCVEEYFGDCAHMVDPSSTASIAQGITKALGGSRGCEREISSRYSWRTTAQGLAASYAELLGDDRPATRR